MLSLSGRFVFWFFMVAFMPIWYLDNGARMIATGRIGSIPHLFSRDENQRRGLVIFAIGMITGVLYTLAVYFLDGLRLVGAYWLLTAAAAAIDDRAGLLKDGRKVRHRAANHQGWIPRHWRGLTVTAAALALIYHNRTAITKVINGMLESTQHLVLETIPATYRWSWFSGSFEVPNMALVSLTIAIVAAVRVWHKQTTWYQNQMNYKDRSIQGLGERLDSALAGYEGMRVEFEATLPGIKTKELVLEVIRAMQETLNCKPPKERALEIWIHWLQNRRLQRRAERKRQAVLS